MNYFTYNRSSKLYLPPTPPPKFTPLPKHPYHCEAFLHDPVTGREGWYDLDLESELEEDEFVEGQIFWWTEGNFGCDCNRSRCLGLERECGEVIELVRLIVNGKDVEVEEM